jgi:ATP-dependent DNA helicase UvrD/PcrA
VPPRSFVADLHIHSKYSRACSRDCDLEHLAWWARRKGVTLLGTGDFTHPAWYQHLRDLLVPAEPGLYRLRPEVDKAIQERLPGSVHGPVRFMLSVEISTIYKRADRTRKVHHLVYLPDLDAVARFNARLGKIGNLGSDGRPILGLDSRDLLEITLEASPEGYLVPAHVWTPWFAVLGSKSGFDTIADCYADLADHIFAIETGLSSDPPMNWQVSDLDRYTLVSNSDAHSPPALAREATTIAAELDYFAVRDALRSRDGVGTIEFYPEEGKYHADGHRKCDLRCDPEQTLEWGGRCPSCGKPLTVGVLSRIRELADRAPGQTPPRPQPYRNLVQLPEVAGEVLGVGARSKAVDALVTTLVARLGPELSILTDVPVADIARAGTPLLGEAIGRLRRGEVIRESGYDGEYGVIRLFDPAELRRPAGVAALFELEPDGTPEIAHAAVTAPVVVPAEVLAPQPLVLPVGTGLLDRLDEEQRAAAAVTTGPLLIVAGPGTGKTRTLTHRLAHLIADHGVPPERCLAITFTRRAAAELADRLAVLTPEHAPAITVTTFHGLGSRILREQYARVGLTSAFRVADEADQLAVLQSVTGSAGSADRTLRQLARARRLGAVPDELAEVADGYAKTLRAWDLVDFDDLLTLPVALLSGDAALAERYRQRWTHVSVDEYQDVDETQYRLLRLLVPPDGDLMAIGDPDQAIYSFRGADVGFFLRFAADYPGATTVRLDRNYRSTGTIVRAAVQAIAPGTLVPGRALTPMKRGIPAPVGLYAAADERDEAGFVARTIDQLLGGSSFHSLDSDRVDAREVTDRGGLSFADIAVLYRTSAQARPVVEAFTRSGVPFQQRSHDRLADRPGVQAVVRELRFAGSGGTGMLGDRVRRVARELADRIPRGFGPEQAGEHAAELHQAADLLVTVAGRCGGDQARFLAELELDIEVDALDPRADKVSLLTLHAAKGLEFPVVFCVGLEDGLLPLRLPGEPRREEDAEERRLLFVGITRAQSRLYLSHAAKRVRQGTERGARPSPFLDAIDPALLAPLNDRAPRKPRPQQPRLF